MRLIHLLRPAAALAAAAALASCDLVPGLRAPAEQAAADTGAVFGDTAGVSQPEARPRRSRTRRPTADRPSGGDPAVGLATGDSADPVPAAPPPPTAYDRARASMSTDLRRLADAQSEHLANEGRYSSRLSRLGLRYLPHAGVSVQLVTGDGGGWSAVATHENFPGQRCGIWVGEAPPAITGIAPAEGIPGCTGG
jgi:hypothetical protein